MSIERWYYFLSIENDFAQTIDYVHLHSSNAKAFSNEYGKLLLLVGSEVDVVAKMLCKKIKPNAKAETINDYRLIIPSVFVGMHQVEIEISRFAMKLKPWENWDPAIAMSPTWWTSHNNVKHERDKNFAEANQENTLNALCGLLVLLLYYFKDEKHLQPYPKLLEYGFPSTVVEGRTKKLPGT